MWLVSRQEAVDDQDDVYDFIICDESTKKEKTNRDKSNRKSPTLARILSFSMYTYPQLQVAC